MKKANFYTSKNGINILREWGNDYEKHATTARKAARQVARSVVIEAGGGLLAGLAYTSTSNFAALWNCGTQARKRGTAGAYFDGVAIDENGRAVIVWNIYDEHGDEIETEFEILTD